MLTELLEKLGVKDPSHLNAEERKVYQSWAEVLAKPETTIEDLKKFLPRELDRAREFLEDRDNPPNVETFWKAYVRLLKTISAVIVTPEKERQTLREHLKQRFGVQA